MVCKRGILDTDVCKSENGFFVAVIDRKGKPQCRASAYAETKEGALKQPMYCQLTCMHSNLCDKPGCFQPYGGEQ